MVQLHVKTTAGKKFSVEIELAKTVAECKTALVAETEVPEAQQRLIFKGKVLKDDQTLESFGIASEDTLYFVRGSANPRPATTAAPAATPAPATPAAAPAPAATPAAPAASPFNFPMFAPPAATPGAAAGAVNPFGNLFGGGGGAPNMAAMQQQMMQNPDMVRQMMDSPIMQSVMNNPEIMRSVLQSNPAIQQLMEQNPQLSHVLNDPELLRQSMEAMRNPAAMREMMRSQDTALRNIESHPEGFNALRRMYHDVQEPLLDAAASGTRAPTNAFAMPGLAGNNATSTPQVAASASTNPTPSANPWGAPAAGLGASNPWAAPAAGANPFGGAADPFGAGLNAGTANPQMMAQLLQSPFMQPMLEQIASNPQLFLSQMEQMNPQMAAALNANPQMRQMMMNPDFLRSMLNPQNLQAMMQMQSAMSQLQGSGLFPGLAAPGGAAAAPFAPAPQANPFDFNALFGGAAGGGFGAAAATPAANPEELYASQLTQLADMGFPNREQNIRALQATAGNVHAAVERLLSGL